MSTSIWVENAKPFQLGLMLPRAAESLRLLLGLTYTPELVGVRAWKAHDRLPEPYYVDLDTQIFGINIAGELAIVSVLPMKTYGAITISPNGSRTKLESALAAAVAIAIGEHSESEISDPAVAFTKRDRQPVKEFVEVLKSDTTFSDITEGASAFFSRLPAFGVEPQASAERDPRDKS